MDTLRGVVTGARDTSLVSTNGGNTWIRMFQAGGFYGVSVVNERRGWSTAPENWFVTTTNGGFTWMRTSPLPFSIVSASDFCFVDTLHGWACGWFGSVDSLIIATKTDGGEIGRINLLEFQTD